MPISRFDLAFVYKRENLSLTAILLALLLFLWTPAHFWAFALVHRGDYRRAGIPMLPVIFGKRTTSWPTQPPHPWWPSPSA